MAKMTAAYSLIRFSTRRQADGDSFRRQLAPRQAFCDMHGLTLDETLHESDVHNHGVSAFKVDNLVKGPLAKFLGAGRCWRGRNGIVVASRGNRQSHPWTT